MKQSITDQAIEIRDLRARDLADVSRIHLLAFRDSALTALGEGALVRYYDWQLNGPHDVSAFAAFRNEEMAGFCFGGVFRGALSGFLQKNRTYLALRVATHPWLVFNPLFRDKLASGLSVLRRFSNPQTKIAQAAKPKKKASFGILAIAVNPNFQGQGIGKILMLESEKVARERGFEEMNLSVSTANHQAIRFYEGLGWQKVLREGIWGGEMIKPLNSNQDCFKNSSQKVYTKIL
jgi:ribosomal protein S18 acetylase RimI-like enzyme